jgi:hypothetical protein
MNKGVNGIIKIIYGAVLVKLSSGNIGDIKVLREETNVKRELEVNKLRKEDYALSRRFEE